MQIICKKKKLKLIIVGTAVSGKSRLSLSIAKHFSWQIVNTDPAWFFQSADVLTNKVTKEERNDVFHFCVDFLELGNRGYQMRQFESRVNGIVQQEFVQRQGIILVGGSNFYNEKVIFQRRARIMQEEKQDYYERLKHNITLFLNEIFFDENLKKISDNMELDLHFHKLLKKETEIDHSCLKSNQNKLKYLLLNAPQKVLECLFEQFDLHLIYGLVKKLYPFTSSTINHQDKTKIRNVLKNFINGKPKSTDRVNESSKNLETLNKKAEEEILVVILYNTDTALAQRLIRGRISKMIFKKEGIKEFFCIFEKLLISPESIYNIIEKYLLNLNHLKCTLDEMILISLNDVKDSIKINKANRYGVLTVKGYKEFFNFFEKFIFILINNFFRITMKNKQKIEEFGSHILKGNFLKYYDHLRDNLIKDLRSSLPLIFKEHGQVKEGDSNYLIKRVFLESLFNLEKELFMLYKKQKTWLQKRIVENNILKDHIFIKEVKNTHLNDKTFNSEVIQPVISRINKILGKEKVKAQIFKPLSLDPTNQPSNSNSPHDIENVKENLQKRNRLSSTQSTVNFKETRKLKRVKQDL
jgi:tRNA A37 N6-isopentenylltransferase MiaA